MVRRAVEVAVAACPSLLLLLFPKSLLRTFFFFFKERVFFSSPNVNSPRAPDIHLEITSQCLEKHISPLYHQSRQVGKLERYKLRSFSWGFSFFLLFYFFIANYFNFI